MVTSIEEYRCPACGNLMGKKEYEYVSQRLDKIVEENSTEQIERVKQECDHRILNLEKYYRYEIEKRVTQAVAVQIQEIKAKYTQELAKKEEEIGKIKTQNTIDVEEKITQATIDIEAKYTQRETERELYYRRIEDDNHRLLSQVEKLQKTLANVPPELRGTASEIVLLDDLQNSFPNDKFTPKIVGMEMADVIQNIVIENGQKIAPPIVWDRKTGDKVTKSDIEKAKKYKEIHNTDFCVIVTEKGITENDSKNRLIGTREEILLVHPSLVIEIAKLLRNFIIGIQKQERVNDGRTSKQAKLYEYLASPQYARMSRTIIEMKSKLEDLQRKEQEYHRKMWNSRSAFIDNWFEVDEYFGQKIDEIIQEEDKG
jgi:hypothetical protein